MLVPDGMMSLLFLNFLRKKIIFKRSNVKYWVKEAYDEILSAQNLAGVK